MGPTDPKVLIDAIESGQTWLIGLIMVVAFVWGFEKLLSIFLKYKGKRNGDDPTSRMALALDRIDNRQETIATAITKVSEQTQRTHEDVRILLDRSDRATG